MRKRTKNETPPRELQQPNQSVSDDIILSNYSTSITNFLNQLKIQQPELDFVNPFQEIIGDISKHLHRHPSRIPLAAISASWQRLSNEILFQVQQVNQKASDSMAHEKVSSLRSAIAQVRTAAPSYQSYKKEHQALYQQIKKSILLIQQSIESHDENRVSQQIMKFKTDLTHSFSKFFQLADMDKAESAQILKQCKRDANQIQRLVAGTNPLIVVPKEFYSFTKYVNSLKFEKKKPEPPRRSKTPPARFPNLICSVPNPGSSQNKNHPTNTKIKPSPSATTVSSVTVGSSPATSAQPKDKYANQSRKVITRSKTPPSRPILMKTIANAQKPRTSKFSAVENYVFPKQYSPKTGLSSSSVLNPQSSDKDKKQISSIKPIGKRPVSPSNSKVNPNAKLNLSLNLNSISNANSNASDASRPSSAREKAMKASNSAKNSSRMIKKDFSKPSLSTISRPVSPGAKQNQPSKTRQQPPLLKYQQSQSPQQQVQNQNQSKSKQQVQQNKTSQIPKNIKNQQIQQNKTNQIQTKKNKQQNEQTKIPTNHRRNQINRYIDDNDIENDNDNDIYNDNSNDEYNENEIDNEKDESKGTNEMKRTDSLQSLDSATDQLVLVMNKTKEQLRVSPTLEKLQRDLSFEGLFLDGDEPAEVKIGRLYKSFSKKLNLFDQLIIANDKINELNQKVEQNTWKDDKELEDYLSLIDENSIIVQFLSREKEIIYDTAKSMRQLNERIDYYLNRNNFYSSLSSNDKANTKVQKEISNDDLTDLYATIDDQLAQINKQSTSEKERNENKKLIKKFDSSKSVFYEFAEKVNAQNKIEEMKLENESLKRRISILKSIQLSADDNDSNDNDNSNNEEFDFSSLNENELNEMTLEEILSIYDYLNSNRNKIKSKFSEDPRIIKNRDKFRPTEEQLKTLASIHQQMIQLQKALVSIQNDEQKVSINDQMLTRNEIESNIMKLITQEKNILQSIK